MIPSTPFPADGEPGSRDVARLLETARSLGPRARVALLDRVRETDPRLADEVDELASEAEAAAAFFDRLGAEVGALRNRAVGVGAAADEAGARTGSDLPPGTEVGRYRIRERIGAGGMGTVYRAHDPHLERDVALKFLPRWRAGEPEARERFLTEARAAAGLDHPNVCTVHEIGEADDGRPFIAMALYGGETLKERLRRGPLPAPEAAEVTRAIARALAAAHRRGLVHRDVKPGNVMLVEGGPVKLLDFGLAKAADTSLTRPGRTPGTVAYMAPEHVRGETVDPRCDLWSLGVVLYEMLTGTRPFRGGSERTLIHAILHEDPRPLSDHDPVRPDGLVGLVERLLRKDRSERCASAEELLETLGESAPRSAWRARITRRRLALASLGTAAVLVVGAVLGGGWDVGTGADLDPDLVAVAPFRVAGADPSMPYLREGMVDLIAAKLRGGGELRPVDPRSLTATWDRSGAGSAGVTRSSALALAGELGAGKLLLGEVVSLPDRVVLTASLHDVLEGTGEPPVTVEGPVDSLPVLVDRLVGGVLSVDAGEGPRLASLTTGSLPALRAYLGGQAAFRRGRYEEATRSFVDAFEADSAFALAALMAWRSAIKLGGATVRTRVSYVDAWRNRERLGQRDREFLELMLGSTPPTVHSSHADLLRSRRELVRRQPDNVEAWLMLGAAIPPGEGPFADDDSTVLRHASEAFRRALALDPEYLPALEWLWQMAHYRGDDEERERYADRFLDLAPEGLAAKAIRCVEAALAPGVDLRAEILAEVDASTPALAGKCVAGLYRVGVSRFAPEASAPRDALARHLVERLPHDPALLRNAGDVLGVIASDAGRPSEAARILEAQLRAGFVDSLSYHAMLVGNALWWDGDRDVGAEAARALADRLDGAPSDGADGPALHALCVLGQWRLATGAAEDGEDADRIARRLRDLGAGDRAPGEVAAAYCADVLDVWQAVRDGGDDADRRLDRLAAPDARRPLAGRILKEGDLALAELLERRGEPDRALAVLRRDRFSLPIYESTFLRERARLAAALGDTALAIDQHRRYLAFRTRPEPAQRAERDRAAREMAVLEGARN